MVRGISKRTLATCTRCNCIHVCNSLLVLPQDHYNYYVATSEQKLIQCGAQTHDPQIKSLMLYILTEWQIQEKEKGISN